MHIVQITGDFLPNIGGMATHVWELSKALVKLGHEVTVLTTARLKKKRCRFMREYDEEREGVRIVNLGFLNFPRRYYPYHLGRRIRKHLNCITPRIENIVLHIHTLKTPPMVRAVTQLPIVWTNHSSGFLMNFQNASLSEELKKVLHSCDWITAPSHELAEKTIRLGYPAKRITYIPNGVDVDRFKANGRAAKRGLRLADKELIFPKEQCVVMCARRFVHKNGLHVYLEALEAMTNAVLSNSTFLFAGNQPDRDGPYGREIEERIRKLSQKTDCQILGPVPNNNMPDLYRIADISVLPSLIEATSITGLESMASGIPIVGTNVGGIPEIVEVEDEVTGLLCQPNDSNQLAKNLETLISCTSMRQRLGANARKLAKSKFAWPIIAKQFLKVYESAIASKIVKM